jgi:hypothetical protein
MLRGAREGGSMTEDEGQAVASSASAEPAAPPPPPSAWTVAPLSDAHLAQLQRAVELALPQWLKPVPDEPERVVAGLERVLLFLRQQGHPTQQARQVASLAFAFGAQVTRATGWSWQSVSEDGGVNPALVSPDGRRACLVVDVVTGLALARSGEPLGGLFRAIVEGADPPSLTRLDGPRSSEPR